MEDKITIIREFEIKTPQNISESHFNTLILAAKEVEEMINNRNEGVFDFDMWSDVLNTHLNTIIAQAEALKVKKI